MSSWKLKKIFQLPKQERSRESLPKPPAGMAWVQHPETREWKLVAAEDVITETTTALANSEITETTKNGTGRAAAAAAAVAAASEEEEVQFSTGEENAGSAPPTRKDPFADPFHLSSSPLASNEEEPSSAPGPSPEPTLNSSPSSPEPEFVQEPSAQLPYLPESPKSCTKSSSTKSSHVLLNLPSHSSDFHFSQESKSADEEADWELLSDRGSISNSGIAFVSRTTGSITSHHSSFAASFQLSRVGSSSTLDSHDYSVTNLGPAGKGVLGVDYVEHVVLSTDTLQGICLAYKLSASRLKRANHFTGDSLNMAPKRLVIPISKKALRQGYLRVQDTDSKEYKMHALQAEFPKCGLTEAKAYLELADWVLRDAIESAREDYEWESNLKEGELRAGEIRVMMNVETHPDGGAGQINFAAQGAGYSPARRGGKATPVKPVDPKAVNATSVKLEDIHSAATHHNSVGMEMQSFSPKKPAASTP